MQKVWIGVGVVVVVLIVVMATKSGGKEAGPVDLGGAAGLAGVKSEMDYDTVKAKIAEIEAADNPFEVAALFMADMAGKAVKWEGTVIQKKRSQVIVDVDGDGKADVVLAAPPGSVESVSVGQQIVFAGSIGGPVEGLISVTKGQLEAK